MPNKKTKKEGASCDCGPDCKCGKPNCGCSGFAYILGIIGSATYYLSTATGFWNGVLGFFKSLIWPVFLVYELLKFVGA